jgi:hypothetical protein
MEGNELRDAVHRNGRYVAMSLERDLQSTGVGIASTPSFGTLSVSGDTIVILSIPHDPLEAPPHDLDPPAGVNNPLDPGGTCGSQCLDLLKVNGTFDLQAGDLARLQVKDTRRLVLVQSVQDAGPDFQLWFTAHPELVHHEAGLSGGLLLDRFDSFVQELSVTIYYRDGDRLMRAERLRADGTPDGDVVSYGIQSWEVTVVFSDGDEADAANAADTDVTNDYDDLVGIRIRAELGADRIDPRINGGQLFTRSYDWRFSPRNLMYERNRI